MSNIRPYLRKLWLADCDGGCNPDDMVFRPTEEIMSEFVYYMLRRQTFIGYVMNDVKGMKMPRDKKTILSVSISSTADCGGNFSPRSHNCQSQIRHRQQFITQAGYFG